MVITVYAGQNTLFTWNLTFGRGPGLQHFLFLKGPGSEGQVSCLGSLFEFFFFLKLEDDWPESIFPQVLIQPRRHLFTSLRRACLRAAMLNVHGHMRAPSHRPTRGNMAVLDPTYLDQPRALFVATVGKNPCISLKSMRWRAKTTFLAGSTEDIGAFNNFFYKNITFSSGAGTGDCHAHGPRKTI